MTLSLKQYQFFFGGDASGATFHWHHAAFNVLYTGEKQWTITPPSSRGITGMPAREAVAVVPKEAALRCTQLPGDMIFVPDYWGHLTLNRGFAIGGAIILHRQDSKFAGDSDRTADNVDKEATQG